MMSTLEEEHPDGCYGLRCRDCKLLYPERSEEDIAECKRLSNLALKKLTQDA